MSSITAPLEGCIALDDLELTDAQLIWFIIGPDRHKAGAWQTDKPGCGPNTHHQRSLLIPGGSEALINPPLTPLSIEFEWERQIPCGRFQIDIHNAVTDEMKALVINTGVVCKEDKPPVVVIPPVTPNVPDTPVVVPEPTTMLLVSGAILLRGVWQKMRG